MCQLSTRVSIFKAELQKLHTLQPHSRLPLLVTAAEAAVAVTNRNVACGNFMFVNRGTLRVDVEEIVEDGTSRWLQYYL